MFPSRQKNLPTKGTAIAYVHVLAIFLLHRLSAQQEATLAKGSIPQNYSFST
jgi:hypothetical protein